MPHIQLAPADYLVVIGYFVLVLGIGVWFRRRLVSMNDYFAGGNQVPWWMAGISHYMSSFSAFAFIAYAQIGYTYGWVAVTLFWVTVPGCLAGALVFAKRWRLARVITPVQFLEERFNGFVRQLCAWAGIPMKIFDDALKIFATGLFVSLAAHLSLTWSIVICSSVMVAYTFFGGVWALIVTDYVQFLMKSLAILLMLPLAIAAAGGLHSAFTQLPPNFLKPVNGPYGWWYLAGFTAVMVVSYNASWSLAQKYYTVKDERAAKKAAYFSAALNVIGAPLMILPAIIGRHILPDLILQHRTADTYVLLVMKLLPAGMVGIIMAAMFSATMATVSGDFNAIAAVLTQDVYHRLIRPSAPEGRLVFVGRVLTLVLGLISTALSLWVAYMHQQSLFNLMVTLFGLFSVPALLPLLGGLVSRTLNWQGAVAGFVGGLITASSALALQTYGIGRVAHFVSTNRFEGLSLLATVFVTIACMWLGTVLFRTPPETTERVSAFFKKLDTPIQPSEIPASRPDPAGPVLALSTIGVGLLLAVAGAISGAKKAIGIDFSVAFLLIAIGLHLRRRSHTSRRVDNSLPGV